MYRCSLFVGIKYILDEAFPFHCYCPAISLGSLRADPSFVAAKMCRNSGPYGLMCKYRPQLAQQV